MNVNRFVVGANLFAALILSACGSTDPSTTRPVDSNDSAIVDQGDDSPRPNPELTPGEVVRIQLEALRGSGASPNGVAIAYRFASPKNKEVVGPIERYRNMLRDSRYASITMYQDLEFWPFDVQDRKARQVVVVETADGETHCYLFMLSKQLDEPYRDCWMTDAVICEQEAI